MEQRDNLSRWGIVIGIILLGVFLLASAEAAVFTITSPFDASDSNPGDGVCETAPGNGVCTLRAAIEETNALAGADTIILPPNTYLLTLVNELTITVDLTIIGGGAATTATCDIGAVEFGAGSATPIDFDGDGRSDIAVYRNGTWFVLRSLDGEVRATDWG